MNISDKDLRNKVLGKTPKVDAENMWQTIEPKLKRKSKRRFIWLWFIFAALIFGGTSIYTINQKNNNLYEGKPQNNSNKDLSTLAKNKFKQENVDKGTIISKEVHSTFSKINSLTPIQNVKVTENEIRAQSIKNNASKLIEESSFNEKFTFSVNSKIQNIVDHKTQNAEINYLNSSHIDWQEKQMIGFSKHNSEDSLLTQKNSNESINTGNYIIPIDTTFTKPGTIISELKLNDDSTNVQSMPMIEINQNSKTLTMKRAKYLILVGIGFGNSELNVKSNSNEPMSKLAIHANYSMKANLGMNRKLNSLFSINLGLQYSYILTHIMNSKTENILYSILDGNLIKHEYLNGQVNYEKGNKEGYMTITTLSNYYQRTNCVDMYTGLAMNYRISNFGLQIGANVGYNLFLQSLGYFIDKNANKSEFKNAVNSNLGLTYLLQGGLSYYLNNKSSFSILVEQNKYNKSLLNSGYTTTFLKLQNFSLVYSKTF